MNQQLTRPDSFFFGTRPLPCPYIDGQVERKVVTELAGPDSEELYERLSRAGFRRSHNLAYRPACRSCNACIPVRIAVNNFDKTRSFRRVVRTNSDLVVQDMDALATAEQYRLFLSYQRARHEGGDMSGMAFSDYSSMVEDTPVTSRAIEFRDVDGSLVAVMLMDRMQESLSAVYSYFNYQMASRSLGTFMILWMIGYAQQHGLPHVYLGYWVDGSEKMSYKARFHPLEVLDKNGWSIMDPTQISNS